MENKRIEASQEGDLISRQVAIHTLWQERQRLDAFMDECLKKGLTALRAGTKAERNRIEEDIEIIKELPSAQPEIISTPSYTASVGEPMEYAPIVRCKDCKHYEEINQPYPQMFCRKLFLDTKEDDFCSYGERKTDADEG